VGKLNLATVLLALLIPGLASSGQTPPPNESGGEQITLQVDSFGVGGHVRPGEWAGLHLRLIYNGSEPRPVIVSWQLPEADGDTVLSRTDATLNPGVGKATGLWLYGKIPFQFDAQTTTYVFVHEALEPPSGSRIKRRGRQLAILPISPSFCDDSRHDMIGVVGTGGIGLEKYQTQLQMVPLSPTAHIVTSVVSQIQPQGLPNRWMGLAPMSTLVWCPEASPAVLRDRQPEAIKQWVRRGGHFVVIMPRVPDIWIASPRENPLVDLLPGGSDLMIRNLGEIPLESIKSLLTNDRESTADGKTVQAFSFEGPALEMPDNDLPPETVPIMVDDQDRPLVIQRSYGLGAVTLIGLDLQSGNIRQQGLLEADRFWNRILGRRADAYSRQEYQAMEQDFSNDVRFSHGINETKQLDDGLRGRINMTGSAARGLLLAVVVFGAYWVVAGPGIWGLLKVRKHPQHAWVAFVGAAAVFAFVSWLGATALKPSNVDSKHVTFVDVVFGQDLQRTTTFFSALLPEYGVAEVRIGEEDDLEHHVIWTFDPPTQALQSFPNSREYDMISSSPSFMPAPSRATAKQFRGQWIGALPDRWGLPYDSERIRPMTSLEGTTRSVLTGVIRHNLPVTLEDVMLVYVKGPTPYTFRDRREPPTRMPGPIAEGWAWRLAGAGRTWAPGDDLVLDDLCTPSTGSTLEDLMDRYAGVRSAGDINAMNWSQTTLRYEAATFYHHITPISYLEQSGSDQAHIVARRR
jgi:hypothetical protein